MRLTKCGWALSWIISAWALAKPSRLSSSSVSMELMNFFMAATPDVFIVFFVGAALTAIVAAKAAPTAYIDSTNFLNRATLASRREYQA